MDLIEATKILKERISLQPRTFNQVKRECPEIKNDTLLKKVISSELEKSNIIHGPNLNGHITYIENPYNIPF